MTVADPNKPKLLDQLREAIRVRHYSLRTEEAYVQWVKRYIYYHGKRHPADLAERHVNRFLSHLAVESRVAASTQNQALWLAVLAQVASSGPSGGSPPRYTEAVEQGRTPEASTALRRVAVALAHPFDFAGKWRDNDRQSQGIGHQDMDDDTSPATSPSRFEPSPAHRAHVAQYISL